MKRFKAVKEIGYFLFFISGWGFFSLVQLLEETIKGGFLFNALLEESMKVILFIFLLAAARIICQRDVGVVTIYPLLIILGFGIVENIVYFIHFPSGAIFLRLFYSYPIHVNTGLIYTYFFVRKKYMLIVPFLALSILYHYGLNLVSINISSKLILCSIGLVNLSFLVYLIYRIQEEIVVRSFINARS